MRRLVLQYVHTDQRWQWVTLFDPWPTWPISQLTRGPRDPWPSTHDYSRVMTPEYCSFQSGPLSGNALKIKHHHCHKILHRNNWIKLTSWLKLCRKSLQCLEKRNLKRLRWVLSTVLNVTRDPLRFVDPLDPWPVTRDTLTTVIYDTDRKSGSPGGRKAGAELPT